MLEDTRQRIALVIEYSLDLNPKIIEHVMGWGNNHKDFLKDAEDKFKHLIEFLQEFTKENPVPRYLISALLDQYPGMPSSKEIHHMREDLHYCMNLIDAAKIL